MNTTDRITETEQLVIERAKLANDRDALAERIAELDSLITASLPAGTHTIADHKLIITTPARLDPKKLETAYPVARFPHLYRPTIDTASVKAYVAPVELEQYKTVGRPQVRFAS